MRAFGRREAAPDIHRARGVRLAATALETGTHESESITGDPAHPREIALS